MAQQTATTQLQRVPNWGELGQAQLLRSWDKPKIRALIQALGAGVQLQEDLQWDLLVSTGLDEATGHALDQWGDLVGEQRGPLSDQSYRQFIKARLLVNRSSGTVDELLEILDVATQPNVGVFHEDNLPAGVYLQVERNSFMGDAEYRRVARLMEDARPGGRHLSVIEALSGGFGFEADETAEGYNTGVYSRLVRIV